MGVKNLRRFLKKMYPDLFQIVSLDTLSEKTVAVDTMLFIHKFKFDANVNPRKRWLDKFVWMLLVFRQYDITPIFTFDTKSPPLKMKRVKERRDKRDSVDEKASSLKEELAEYRESNTIGDHLRSFMTNYYRDNPLFRVPPGVLSDGLIIFEEAVEKEIERLEKQNITITHGDIATVKELFQLSGIQWFDAEYEAETSAVWLVKNGKADTVLSDDTDVLVYGIPFALSNIRMGKENSVEIVYTDRILERTGLTLEQFQDFCILCGTDYNDNIFRIGSVKAFQLIKKHGSVPEIGKTMDVSVLNYDQVSKIFTEPTGVLGDLEHPHVGSLETLQLFLSANRCDPNLARRLIS